MPTKTPEHPTDLTRREPARPVLPSARIQPLRHAATEADDGEQPVLSIRALVPESRVSSFVAEALRDIRAYLEEHHLVPTGPPFLLCRPTDSGEIDAEAGWPLAGHARGTARIHEGSLPKGLLRRRPAAYGQEGRVVADADED